MIMCTLHYFKWLPGYLNHVDLLMSYVHLSCLVDFVPCPTDKYMFKVNNSKKKIDSSACIQSNVSLHRIEINYDPIKSILVVMDICFSSKFSLGIPSE